MGIQPAKMGGASGYIISCSNHCISDFFEGSNRGVQFIAWPGTQNAEQGFLAARRGGKRGKRYDLGSKRCGEQFRYITQPWFQDDLGVVGPEFQASGID